MRRVVLLCGPPGAGKTTAARASGLQVFDRDDEQWSSERQFTQALRSLATDPRARAVVIRSGATSSARARSARMIGATEVYLMAPSEKECQRRAHARGRADLATTRAAIPQWFRSVDRLDGVAEFTGWRSPAPVSSSSELRPSRAW